MKTETRIRNRLHHQIDEQERRGEYDSRDMAYDLGVIKALQWVLDE